MCGILGNGYPHENLSVLKVNTKEEAYYATKTALWIYLLGNWSINGLGINPNLTGADKEAAQRVLDATKWIYYRGMEWTELATPKLTATPDKEKAYPVTINGEACYQQIFTIESGTWSLETIKVQLAAGAPAGTKIMDMDDKEIDSIAMPTNRPYQVQIKVGSYSDHWAFSNLITLQVADENLKEFCPQFSISLHNLSSTFLLVKYRFYCSENVSKKINLICKTQYCGRTDVFRMFPTAWYKPQKFGHSMMDGNQVRYQELYVFLSDLKWNMLKLIRSMFKVHFIDDNIFPPVFETYSTNIRPSNTHENRKFWRSVMFSGPMIDYAPNFNACVVWDYKNGKREGIRLAAYCGGQYSNQDHLSEIAQHEISDTYAVYMTANALLYVARHKIEMCDRIISKTIRKAGTAKILKARVDIEKKL